jgi:hypothetical protein
LRERASRHGHSLQQELLLILEAAAAEPVTDLVPPPPDPPAYGSFRGSIDVVS